MAKSLKNPSVMKHLFSEIPEANIPRSNFRRSHGYKTTFDSGYLIPIFVDEALPGDTFNLTLSSVARLATPIVPIMDNIQMDFFFFAVPNRLLWDKWQRFMGEQPNPGDSIDFRVPQITAGAGGFAIGSLSDYFGIPTGVTGIKVNALHHRAYNLIWNEWFRDQNLQNSVTVDTGDGPDVTAYTLLKRGKRHDYFTSCLPWPQKGPDVELPLGALAPITGLALKSDATPSGGGPHTVKETNNTVNQSYAAGKWSSDGSGLIAEIDPVRGAPYPNIYADLSSATASTINSLREAFQLQKMLERDARGGTRYTEILKSHFMVESPDGRLQRPEYLGGGTTPVIISPIPQTSRTEVGGTPQGNLSAIGYQSNSGIGFTKSFVEHCVIVGLVNVRADLTYQQGLNRMWSRQTRYDYFWPALANLGEQSVLNKEIYAQGPAVDSDADGTPDDDEVFGYQERWAEYRYFPSKITGKLRSADPTSLDCWHLSQDFTALPALNSSFIEEDPPIDRVVAVNTEPQFIFDAYFDIICTRPMPAYSVPGLIDHF